MCREVNYLEIKGRFAIKTCISNTQRAINTLVLYKVKIIVAPNQSLRCMWRLFLRVTWLPLLTPEITWPWVTWSRSSRDPHLLYYKTSLLLCCYLLCCLSWSSSSDICCSLCNQFLAINQLIEYIRHLLVFVYLSSTIQKSLVIPLTFY